MEVMGDMGYNCTLKLRRMVFCWLLFLVLSVIHVHSNDSDDRGFINIDCGLPSNTSILDSATGLRYVSDDQFIDTGVNYQISSTYRSYASNNQSLNVRSFPKGIRNCYTLRSLQLGSKYLVRAAFMYGNYDNLDKPPSFDVHFGVNFWDTITFSSSDTTQHIEIIAIAPDDYIQVCLVNKGLGNPFISLLELRYLKSTIYPLANASQSLTLLRRHNEGASKTPTLRYPRDPYDRIWQNYPEMSTWEEITTTSVVTSEENFEMPSIVLQTAVTGSTSSDDISFNWVEADPSATYFMVLHMTEIEDLAATSLREFDVIVNEESLFPDHFIPLKFQSGWAYFTRHGYSSYDWSLVPTKNSTLPPILNAFEILMILPVILTPSYSGDVTAMNTIKTNYKVDKGWNGDPCVPANISWSGVSCTSNSSGISRITSLDVSSSGLSGAMVSSFGDLTELKKLDVSGNKLSGPMPISMDQLTSLASLDTSGNSLTLSPGLQKRQQSGALTVINSNSPIPCTHDCKKNIWIIIVIVVVVILLALIAGTVTTILCFRKRRMNTNVNIPRNYIANVQTPDVPFPIRNAPKGEDGLHIFESRQFDYKELKMITNNFQNNIGTGGFGSVYVGRLENETQVAVKMRSHSSSQGVKEFLAEAKNLTRVHHKHLVSLMGYCMDGDCMALVYEYMQEGTLQGKLRDDARPLTWKQRLKIGYESAQGLDYLHNSCNPPLIHRDVKTSNILLNSNLEAKIADFGLSRAFGNDVTSHVSTAVVGTPGYLDPEYYQSYQLSKKSDVFSFGVVLLEIVTGQPPVIGGPEGGHISDWVKQRLSKGDIERIVDSRMRGQYDINSVWKVTTLAEKCTERSSLQRPTMNMVVADLKESLQLEISTEGNRTTSTPFMSQYTNQYNYSRNDNLVSDVSQNSGFEMAYMHGVKGSGPSAR